MLLLAGRQGGKTRIGTLGGVLEASMPNSYGWVTAPTYRDLLDFVEPAFFAQLPQSWLDEGDWNVSDRLLLLPNGARVAFRSLEDPQSVRGPTLDWWLMDEACKVSGVAHEVGDAMLAIKEGVEILTTTPRGEDWVYEEVWLSGRT
jgi:phage terminase large subunit-like protein